MTNGTTRPETDPRRSGRGSQIVERWNEYIARNLREKLGMAGAFIVACPHPASDDPRDCDCFLGRNFAVCERCESAPAQHDIGGALMCTECRDESAVVLPGPDHEPTDRIPAQSMHELIKSGRAA